MKNHGLYPSRHGLDLLGLGNVASAYWNLPAAQLYEQAIRRGEALLAAEGPLVARCPSCRQENPELTTERMEPEPLGNGANGIARGKMRDRIIVQLQ